MIAINHYCHISSLEKTEIRNIKKIFGGAKEYFSREEAWL
jgi:hypothetical protein